MKYFVILFFSFSIPSIFGQVNVGSNQIQLDTVNVLSSTLHQEEGHVVYSKNEFDIQNSPYQNVGELLETYPGLEIRSRSLNDVQADISLRGSSFDQVLVLVNGVPYSDPQTGHHNLNLPVPLGSIATIHVMPSGGSYRYGPFAFAGVIDIVTKVGSDLAGYATAGVGQYGYQNGAAGISLGEILGFSTRIDLDYKAADGAISNTDFVQWQGFFSAERQIKSFGKLIISGGYLAKRFGAQNFYSFNFPEQFEAIRSLSVNARLQGSWGKVQVYGRQHHDHFELFREEAGFYESLGSGQFLNTKDSTMAPSWYSEHNNHRSNTYGLDYETKDISAQVGDLTAVIKYGMDFRRDEIISNVLGTLLITPIIAPDNRAYYLKGDIRNNAGVFYKMNLGTLTAALRLNYNDRYGFDWLPNLDFVQSITGEGSIKASVNRSFRLPTFTDLYYTLGGAQGSATLKPEYAWNSEVSYQTSLSPDNLILPSNVNFTVYHRYGTNLIDWVYRTVGTEELLQADNITQVSIYGIEFNAKGDLLNRKLFYTLSGQFASHQTGQINGQSIYVLDYLSNRFQGELQTAPFKGYKIGLIGTRQERAGSYVNTTSEVVKYPAFSTLDIRLSFDHDGLLIFIDALNLFDEKIYDRGNVPLPGRWVKAGLRFHW
tara:strand:- start:4975 stop:6942 length:1968 start_codon:yes stop_codon:yes gene_type:complete